MSEVKSKVYTLRNENGSWLGQVVLTSDGMFAGVTDWGNLSYAWRRIGECTISYFLIGLSTDYFASKLQNGLSHIAYDEHTKAKCERFAENILPPLQKLIREDIDKGEAI